MKPRDLLILAYAAHDGEIRGRTRLQKTLYFLGVLLDHVDELGYRPHFFGPYSDEVAAANAELKALGYLSESVAGVGALNSQGFEIARHDFGLTQDGNTLAERTKKRLPDVWSKVQEATEKLKAAGDLDYNSLSIAAKTYHIVTAEGGTASSRQIIATARELGWPMSQEDVKAAAAFLQDLKLVTCE